MWFVRRRGPLNFANTVLKMAVPCTKSAVEQLAAKTAEVCI
jgi:hypothetical protein